jgi:hypothetical protein
MNNRDTPTDKAVKQPTLANIGATHDGNGTADFGLAIHKT